MQHRKHRIYQGNPNFGENLQSVCVSLLASTNLSSKLITAREHLTFTAKPPLNCSQAKLIYPLLVTRLVLFVLYDRAVRPSCMLYDCADVELR